MPNLILKGYGADQWIVTRGFSGSSVLSAVGRHRHKRRGGIMFHVLGDTTRPIMFLLVSAADHVTPVTGATPAVTRSKNGGAFAAWGGGVVEIANGLYKATPIGNDVDTTGELIVHATAAGADPSDEWRLVISNLMGFDTPRFAWGG